MGQLKSILLQDNSLTGPIPSELGRLSLSRFFASNNHLEGSIPEELWQITKLIDLRLDGNKIDGSISNSLGNLLQIEKLYLNSNLLTGSLPISFSAVITLGTYFFWAQYSISRYKISFDISEVDPNPFFPSN